MRLIDADNIVNFHVTCSNGKCYVLLPVTALSEIPTVDPIKHGRWEHHLMPLAYKCSCCGAKQGAKAWKFNSKKYCPECGAKMDFKPSEAE